MLVDRIFTLHLTVFSLLAISLGLIDTSSLVAQPNQWGGGARGTAARVIGQRWKVASNQANLFSGPSAAYSQRGRIYQGEWVTILEVTSNQEWARVNTPAGIQGWIRVSKLQRPQDQLSTDPGRRRRQTDYQYDGRGRRINYAGQAVGSGQGTQFETMTSSVDDPEADAKARAIAFGQLDNISQTSSLIIEIVPTGVTYFTRRFSSNTGTAPLSGIESSVASPSFGLRLASHINDYIHLEGRFLAAIGREVPLPVIPSLSDIPASDIKAHQYTGDFQMSAGSSLDDKIWLGGVVGAQYYELGYREVLYPTPAEKLSPLQTHRYFSATIGARLSLRWDAVSWDLRGGGALPLMFSQSPNSEGQWSCFGVWARTRLGYQLNASFALAISMGYIRYGADYTGPAEQADYTQATPVFYTAASGSDQSVETQLSVSYQL